MNVAYKILFSVKFRHGYFADSSFRGLKAFPDESTLIYMRNHAIVFKETGDGFQVIYECRAEEAETGRTSLLDSPDKLRFILKLEDPSFFNYTAIQPSSLTSSVFYFQNPRSSDRAAPELHVGDYVSGADMRALSDLDTAFFVKPFGLIDIQLYKDLPEMFFIRFLEKSTYWRYLLVSDHLRELSAPAVASADIVFKGPSELILPDNKKAIAFESVERIPLSQRSKQTFQLLENFDIAQRKGRVILRVLPVPDIHIISSVKKEEREHEYSEIIL
ncbi:MAG: hypothetical protein JST26_08700 [Bacteroidetes bacterium]|nr:hypothetical protein [Bacteroidota bacterium]